MAPDTPIDVPELLAPAGGPESLRAAVANGADAVYLGTRELNARRGAENFEMDSLAEHARFAHLRGVRVYLTANVVVLPDEMTSALEMAARAWEAGVDAIIVQDLGFMRLIRRELPGVRIHASTQVDAHNSASIAALAGMGVSRVTLARELTVDEIASLVRGADVEIESFVHGSLCVSHSGQCLFSSMVGGRSANRGLCAQPCRLPYALVSADGSEARTGGRHLLSTADLAGITVLPALIASGVSALKIEGRMKSPEYVATVVRVYRAALDRAAADPESFQVTDAEWDLLAEAFTRGFSEAYLSGITDDRMMSYARPNNRGLAVGRVTAVDGGEATVSLDRAVESGDTLEFWMSSGRHAQKAGRMKVSGAPAAAAPAGVQVRMEVAAPVRRGDRVFRVTNASLLEAARRTFAGHAEHRPVPARISVRLRMGEPATVSVAAGGEVGTAQGAAVEPARTKAITVEEVMEHVGRLGGTPYEAEHWAIELDDGAGISYSVLHGLRREAIERLDAARLAPWERPAVTAPRVAPPRGEAPATDVAPRLVVAASDPAVADACVRAGADAVLLSVTARDRRIPDGMKPLGPRIAHDADVEPLVSLIAGLAGSSGNLGLLARVAGKGDTAADWGLNAVNPWTAEALGDLGADLVWASPELSSRQLAALAAASPVPVGTVVHGRSELMVTEHCVLQAAEPCAHDCPACPRRSEPWSLRDRKGYRFPVRTDSAGRSHVYNSVPLDLSRALDEVVGTGVAAVRLDLHTEQPAEAARLVQRYRALLVDVAAGRTMPASPIVTPSTTGHFFRGVA